MISYDKLKDKPRVFQSIVGLSLSGFDKLLPAFHCAYEIELEKRDKERKSPRQRQRGGGRKGEMPAIEDKLLFILFYFRVYPTQTLQGYLFVLSQPQANYWIHCLTPILNQALGYEQQLPARRAKDVKAVLETCPGLEFISQVV